MPKYLKSLLLFLIIYIIIFSFFIFVSPNMDIHALGLHSRRFIPATLACIFPYILFKEFNLKNFYIEAILSILWSVTSPYIAYICTRTAGGNPCFPYDVATGPYLFSTLVFAKILIKNYSDFLIVKLGYYLFELLLFIIPIFNIIYYIKFGHSISANGMMILFQTNLAEASEYLLSLNWKYIAFAFILFIFLSSQQLMTCILILFFQNISSLKTL